jgi:serine/threonine protein kinase
VDLFALGCTAYEVFTGHLPWEKSLNSDETVRRRLNSPPRQAKVLKPDMTDELARILMKSIDIDRTGRYNSANEFKEALQGMKKTDY